MLEKNTKLNLLHEEWPHGCTTTITGIVRIGYSLFSTLYSKFKSLQGCIPRRLRRVTYKAGWSEGKTPAMLRRLAAEIGSFKSAYLFQLSDRGKL